MSLCVGSVVRGIQSPTTDKSRLPAAFRVALSTPDADMVPLSWRRAPARARGARGRVAAPTADRPTIRARESKCDQPASPPRYYLYKG